MNWLTKNHDKITFAYILCFMGYLAINDIAFFVMILHTVNRIVYPAFAVVGVILLLWDLFTQRRLFKAIGTVWLLGFIGAILLSSIINIRYGFTENIKTTVWACIIMLVLYPYAYSQSKERIIHQIKVIANLFGAITLICGFISFYQYLRQINFTLRLSDDPACRQGFMEGRLFGVFTDPNYASILMLCAIAFSFIYIFNSKKLLMKIFHIINIILSFIYVILADSRTAHIVMITAIAISLSLALYRVFFAKKLKRLVALFLGILIGISSSVIVFISLDPLKYSLGYLPEIIFQLTDPSHKEGPLKPIDNARPDVGEDKDISNHRFEIWSDAITLWQATPLVGTSPRNHLDFADEHFPNSFMVKHQYSIHNGYLSVLTYTGIIGAIAMIGFIVSCLLYLIKKIVHCSRKYPTSTVMPLLAIVIMITIAAFPMMMIFFLNTARECIFWLSLGYLIALMKIPEELPTKPPVLYRVSDKLFTRKVNHET